MPLKFEIYRRGERVLEFAPMGAVAMGPESVPVQGDIAFDGGLLVVSRSDELPVGLGLLWDMGEPGAYFLETTRLMPRPQPYLLNVELARFRLMRIVQKQEDWNLFDFPRAEKFAGKFSEAQNLLAAALGKLDDPATASVLADQALALGVELSEELGAFHADLLIQRRRANGAFVRHVVGCQIDSSIQNEKYRETLTKNFDYAILPMSWRQMEPEEHQFDTGAIDDWVEHLSRKRMPIIAGPLIQLDDQHLPDWMFIWEHDFDSLREMAYEYVQQILQRYRKAVSMWNVVAGLHAGAAFSLSFEQIIELTRLLVSQVKALLPSTRTLITITQPFGEYLANAPSAVPPLLYAEMVAQAGINFEAFGVELEMGVPKPGMFTRDLFQLSCLLDKFATMGRPLFLTCMGVPGRNSGDPEDRSSGQNDPSKAGRWKRPWDPILQAEWMDAVYHMALSKPYVESLAWANLADIRPTLPAGGLLDDVLQAKPAMGKLVELREKFHSWHGRKGT